MKRFFKASFFGIEEFEGEDNKDLIKYTIFDGTTKTMKKNSPNYRIYEDREGAIKRVITLKKEVLKKHLHEANILSTEIEKLKQKINNAAKS